MIEGNRMRRYCGVFAMLAALAACAGHPTAKTSGAAQVAAARPAVLPAFDTFFAPASYIAPQLSPDGRWISWIAPVQGVNNFFAAPLADLSAKRQLTFRTSQGVRPFDVSGVVMYHWSADSRYLLYPHDYQGDEHWNIWRVDVEGGGEQNLTPDPVKSYAMVQISGRHPDRIAVSAGTFGKYDAVYFTLDLASGAQTAISGPPDPGTLNLMFDADFSPRVRFVLQPDRAIIIERRRGSEWLPMRVVPRADRNEFNQATYQKIARISEDGRSLYTYSSAGRDTNALVSYDLESGAVRLLGADARVDIGGVLYDPGSGKPLAYSTNWLREQWHAIAPAIAADLKFLAGRHADADYEIASASSDNRKWVVEYIFPNSPDVFYLYDRARATLTELAVAVPELEGVTIARTYSTQVQSSDGLPLISYYSIPIGSDPRGDGVPLKPLPTVLVVHGGPGDERAIYGSSYSVSTGFVQWLASRGYVVYNLNYRGSAGFGKKYANAANGEWGGKMHADLLEQLRELVRRGIADPKRVAIMGGSYGGYATLVGMTMTPGVFACGVDWVGPSSLEVPMPHWEPEEMAIFLGGDPRTKEGLAFLHERSPLAHAADTTGALLIGQGANDSRVPQRQSDQLVDIMQKAGAQVVYAVFPDEGHGFRRRENKRAFWGLTDIFLGKCLGGYYEPLGDKLEGSSIAVPNGAGHIPGLPEALAAHR